MFTINPDGSNMQRVGGPSPPLGVMQGPRLSLDGRQLAYTRIVNPQPLQTDIFVYDLPSGPERRITFRPGAYRNISWTPDRTQLLVNTQVMSDADFNLPSHCWIPLDGSPWARLRPLAPGDRRFSGDYADLSRDGQWLVFLHGTEAWVAGLDGSYVRKLWEHNFQFRDCSPTLSPDGTQVAFLRDFWEPVIGAHTRRSDAVREFELCVIPSHGGDPAVFAEGLESLLPQAGQVAWSPDGKEVLVVCGLASDAG